MIPKIIHCFWEGGEKPRLIRMCRASWARFAPGWRVREWNGETARELRDLPGYAFFESARAAGKWAMASDWLRMAALWKDGGVYLDCDVELVGDLSALCDGSAWISSEWTAAGGTWLNPGSGFGLERGSRVAELMLEEYARTAFDPEREMMPWINEKLRPKVESEGVAVLPPEVMSPIDGRGRLHRTGRTVGIHRYAMSGASVQGRLARWLSWHGLRGLVDAGLKLKGKL